MSEEDIRIEFRIAWHESLIMSTTRLHDTHVACIAQLREKLAKEIADEHATRQRIRTLKQELQTLRKCQNREGKVAV